MFPNLIFMRLKMQSPAPNLGIVYFVDTITNSCMLKHMGARLRAPDNDNLGNIAA